MVPRFSGRVAVDPFEDLNQSSHSHIDPSFLREFTLYSFDQRLADFKNSAGNRPLSLKGRTAAPHKQNAAIRNYDPADANYWALRIFATLRHILLCEPQGKA